MAQGNLDCPQSVEIFHAIGNFSATTWVHATAAKDVLCLVVSLWSQYRVPPRGNVKAPKGGSHTATTHLAPHLEITRVRRFA